MINYVDLADVELSWVIPPTYHTHSLDLCSASDFFVGYLASKKF